MPEEVATSGKLGWARVAVGGALIASLVIASDACSGDTEAVFESQGGGGTTAVDTSTSPSGNTGGTTITVSGGAGGVGGQGGTAGADVAFQWSAPALHLEEYCPGEVPIGAFETFAIPENTFGFTVVAQAASANTVIGLERLRPGGLASVIADFDVPGKNVGAFVNLGIVSGANPQSDSPQAWPMFIGDWRARFGDDGAGTPVDMCIYARRSADGLPHGGVMDINVRIAPGAGVSNGYVQSVLDSVFATFFGPAVDLAAGTVTFGVLGSEFDTLDDPTELFDMFRSSAGIGPRPAVNLFVVGDFTGPEFGNAIGVAGGIPGTAVVHGTARSGVAFQASGDVAFDAGVLAHELGHYGGLWHTTETSVDENDPLGDTPECANIGNNPNACPDVDNVMFPIAFSGSVITEDQARVLAGSALYRGATTAGGSPGASLPASALASWQGSGAQLSQTLSTISRRAPADAVERLLSSLWCVHGGTDHLALVRERASLVRLRQIATDAGAFDLARGRALDTLSRFAASPSDVAKLVRTASEVLQRTDSGRFSVLAAIAALATTGDATREHATKPQATRAHAVLVEAGARLHLRGDALVSRRLAALGL